MKKTHLEKIFLLILFVFNISFIKSNELPIGLTPQELSEID